MERKKNKNCIVFPLEIDMGQYVKGMGQDMYELRGVLLHKGASAYHGHYEAQVYDGRYVAFDYWISVCRVCRC